MRTIAWTLAIFLCLVSSASVRSAGQGRTPPPPSAFFYQTVSPTAAVVRAGATYDGTDIRTYDVDLVFANHGPASPSFGDPVFSRLENGRWAMTAWKHVDTGRPGPTALAYFESECPLVTDAEVKVLRPSAAPGCQAQHSTAMAKTSQVFAADGSNYLFVMSGGEIYLTRLTDASRPHASELSSICVRQTPADSIADLAAGDSTRVLSRAQAEGLLLSDTAIARRTDGTWVLFVKGIVNTPGCAGGNLCELCARSIYRATSADLIHWSSIERVVTQASVPEAVRYPDGTVWLYYQNFAKACAANDLRLAARASITGVFELDDDTVSMGFDATFSHEDFETNISQHSATNGNPIALPDAEAYAALNACMSRSPR